jgi:mono/diheme cytochrome c family protein
MDRGLRAVRQKNCASCHVIEPGSVTFTDDDGAEHTERGLLQPPEGRYVFPPMDERWPAYLAEYEAETQETLEEVFVTLYEPFPDGPTPVGENLFLDPHAVSFAAPWGGDFVEVVLDYYFLTAPEEGIEDLDGAKRSYYQEALDKVRWTFAPPVLVDEGYKVQRDWFYAFLKMPMPLRQQMRVRMPTFKYFGEDGDASLPYSEAGAIADYFAHQSAADWPARFAKRMRLELGQSVAEVAAGAKLGADAVRGIERGVKPDIEAGLGKLQSYAASAGFSTWPSVDPNYEATHARSAGYLAGLPEGHFASGAALIGGVNCMQCHFLLGAPPSQEPIAWAPDLFHARDRLRQDWVEEWLINPIRVYPGTAMPDNFPFPEQPGEEREQVRAVVDFLFNLDRPEVQARARALTNQGAD